jgi:hypothetical protein
MYDPSSYAGDLSWKGDVAARFHDFLSRKAAAGGERIGALWRKVEGMVSAKGLLSALRLLRREAAKDPVVAATFSEPADDAEELFQRIRCAGRKGTIEDYTAFLFTVEVLK